MESQEPSGPRLDSWKEIAAHLRRDVRTVQRWHRRAGLPVHHHEDPRQRGVFANRSELDAWSSRVRDEMAAGASSPTLERGVDPWYRLSPRGALVVGVAAAGLIGAIALVLVGLRARSTTDPARPIEWMLVTVEPSTAGEASELQADLERELALAASVAIMPRERVQRALRLLRRPEETRLTSDLARDVAIRDGDVRTVVTGREHREGQTSLVTLALVETRSGETHWTGSERVETVADEPQAIRRLAAAIAAALRQRPARANPDPPLPRVTTASLEALRLFARAEEALAAYHWGPAAILYESALAHDPDFAAAHGRLAFVLDNEPDAQRRARAAHHTERALALSATVTEAERLDIEMLSFARRGELATAAAAGEALVRIRPEDWRARLSLGFMYAFLQRTREAVEQHERAAALRPDDFNAVVRAAQAWEGWGGDTDRARPHVDRALSLLRAVPKQYSSEVGLVMLPPVHARDVAWVRMFPAYDRWRSLDLPAMLAHLRREVDAVSKTTGPDRDAFLTIGVALAMSAGRLEEARTIAELMFQEGLRELHLAVVADVIDDVPGLRTHLARVPVERQERPLRFVRAGLLREAETILARMGPHSASAAAARGELARRRGEPERAIAELRRAIELGRHDSLSERYLAAESLAIELDRLGQNDEAIRVLEAAAADVPRHRRTGPGGAYWLRVLGRLSQHYRAAGRAREADATREKLGALLAVADHDHPLRRQNAPAR